jgi:hypothetical protein
MLPVQRLNPRVGEAAEAPAVYMRALDLSIERLDQHYQRLSDEGDHAVYEYSAPGFGFECRLVYDRSGLVLEYPGIATRVL